MKSLRILLIVGWVLNISSICVGQDVLQVEKEIIENFVKQARKDTCFSASEIDAMITVYNQYTKERIERFRCSFLMLNNLAKAAERINSNEALDCINSLLVQRDDDLMLRNKYKDLLKKRLGKDAADFFAGHESQQDQNMFSVLSLKQ